MSNFSTNNNLKDISKFILNAEVAVETKIIVLVSLRFKDSSITYGYRFSNGIFSMLTKNRAPLYLGNKVTYDLYNSKN